MTRHLTVSVYIHTCMYTMYIYMFTHSVHDKLYAYFFIHRACSSFHQLCQNTAPHPPCGNECMQYVNVRKMWVHVMG